MRAIDRVRQWISGVTALAAVAAAVAQPARKTAPGESDYIVQSWQTSDGLSANVILSIEQTPDGYLWLGTSHGLVRFDGVRFESYLTTREPHRLGTRIEGLDLDSAGRLWIVAEQKGLVALQKGQFKEFHTNDTVLTQTTISICADATGGIWILDVRGNLARIPEKDPGEIETVEFKLPAGARLLRDGQSNIWGGASRNISGLVDGKWKRIVRPRADVQAIGASRDGGLWLAMDGRLHRLDVDGKSKTLEEFPWNPGATIVTALFEDERRVLWIGTSSRGVFQRVNQEIKQILAEPRSIKCLAQDAEGNLWIGTRGGGLARVRERIFRMVDSSSGLNNEYINTITEDSSGRVWLATEENGLGWMENGLWQPVGANEGWKGFDVFCLAPDLQNGVWVGTAGQGLWHWRSNQFTRVRFNPGLPAVPPRCLHQARDGTLWMVLGDVALFSINDGTSQRHGYRNGLNTQRVRTIAEDADGGIWAGDWHGGIWCFTGDRWQEVRPPASIAEAVRAMLFDARGNLWIATASAGLLRLQGDTVVQIGLQHGLPGEDIEQMLADHDSLWFGTSKGLFHASLEQLNDVAEGRLEKVEAIHHAQSEGLSELHFTGRQQPRSWRTAGGELWFATANGALSFRAADLPTNGPPVKAIIEDVLVNGQSQPPGKRLRLRSDARRLEFRFTAPDFTSPERLRFYYQLQGVDDGWMECGPNRSATYANLPFGTHVFRVAACNAAGAWGAIAESATVTVRPYFWQTQWFVALVAAMLAGGLAWGARRATLLRLSQKLKMLEHEHALQHERARISQDIHDELGANLTTIGLLADMGDRHKTNPEALSRDLAQISEMARGTASAMDAIVWAVNPRNDSLDHFANYVGQFTKDFFRPTSIRTRLDLPASLPSRSMSANVRHNLFLAVKEALNNVVRHADAGEVRLSLQSNHDNLLLTVEDDGKGMPAVVAKNGHNGLTNMRTRIEKVRGTLVIEPVPGGGTRLRFSVPLGKLNTN